MDATLAYFDALLLLHQEVATKSRALSSSCEALVAEKDALVEFAAALRAKLRFFDEFEAVFSQVGALATLSLHSLPFGFT